MNSNYIFQVLAETKKNTESIGLYSSMEEAQKAISNAPSIVETWEYNSEYDDRPRTYTLDVIYIIKEILLNSTRRDYDTTVKPEHDRHVLSYHNHLYGFSDIEEEEPYSSEVLDEELDLINEGYQNAHVAAFIEYRKF